MEIRAITEQYAVSPQITPDDVALIASAGYRTIICNRPDSEVVPELYAEAIRQAATKAGLAFVEIPLPQREMLIENIRAQWHAIEQAEGPVLAYCASGTRSTIVWMFGAAAATPVDEVLDCAIRAGYPLAGLRPQLEAVAAL